MPRLTPQQQLEKLQEQERQLKAKMQRAAAKIKSQERNNDTRRKILAGAVILNHEPFQEELRKLLDQHLVRNDDRALFGLPVASNGGKRKEKEVANSDDSTSFADTFKTANG